MASLLDHYREMAWYNREMNRRIYRICSDLTDEERKRDLGAFFRSIHGTLNHLLLADRAWLARFTGDAVRFKSRRPDGAPIEVKSLGQILYDDWEELKSQRQQTDEDWTGFVAALDPEWLDRTLTYRNGSGEEFTHPLWWALSHVFNHQPHHRGQVTTIMKQLGRDPGVTDLVALLRTR